MKNAETLASGIDALDFVSVSQFPFFSVEFLSLPNGARGGPLAGPSSHPSSLVTPMEKRESLS